jgi:hypothetical protein
MDSSTWGGSKIGLNRAYNNLNHPFKHITRSGRSQAVPTAGGKKSSFLWTHPIRGQKEKEDT